MDILAQESIIRFGDIDQSDTMTIGATFDLFQEAAINHAEDLGVGREAMTKSGQVWILSRLSVFMERRPRFGEKVTIRTWPRGSNKLFAIRDYSIFGNGRGEASSNGNAAGAAVRGRSAWLIVDLEKRRPLRPQALIETLPPNEGVNALPGANPEGNDPPPSLTVREFSQEQSVLRRACYSDIDYNGHVNNTRYIQWIQDLMEPEILEAAKQIRLDINYLSEVRYGETIRLFLLPIKGINTDGMPGSPEGSPLQGQTPIPCKAAFAIEGRRETPSGTGEASGTSEAVPVFRAELRTG